MCIFGVSKTLVKEVENNLELFSKFFDLQNTKIPHRVSSNIFAAETAKNTFILTNFEGKKVVVDILPLTENVKIEMLKHNSIKKLIEVKKGNLIAIEDSLAGSALPFRP